MKRNSTRSYWLSNDSWYTIVDGKFELTPEAPPEAQKSFAEWNTEPKLTWRGPLRKIRTFFY